MHIHTHTQMCIYMYLYTCLYTPTHIHLYAHTHTHTYVWHSKEVGTVLVMQLTVYPLLHVTRHFSVHILSPSFSFSLSLFE